MTEGGTGRMKKNLRAILTYAILGLICVSALVGYLASEIPSPDSAETAAGGASGAPAQPDTETVSAAGAMTPSAYSPAAPSASAAPTPSATPAPTPAPPETRTPMTPEEHLLAAMQASSEMPSEHTVAIAQGTDYNAVAREVIERAGGLKGIVKPGDTVLIKPNLIQGKPAGNPICSDWRTIQAIADMAWECGAASVVVAEASPRGNVFKRARFDKIKGVKLADMSKCKPADCYYLKPERSLTGKKIRIPKIYMDADVVIGAAKLKTHNDRDAVVSLGLKLSMGVPPAGKNNLHNYGLKKSIVDLNRIRRPDFMVIEGIIGGEGNGPNYNTPVKSGVMFAGRDIVALDTVALTFMGFTVKQCPHVKLASDEGLGISDLSQITVVGADLDEIKMKFKRIPAVK